MIQDILLAGIKFTLSISVVVILYKTLLSTLTFFKTIRWYFLTGIVLSVLISCFTITIKTPVAPTLSLAHKIVNHLPAINNLVSLREDHVIVNAVNYKQVLLYIWWAGILVFVIRLLLQFISLINLRKRSKKIEYGPLKIYLLKDNISSFAFGNSIFIHPGELRQSDYEKIIEHEWVHIRQQHTIDMLIGEAICVINWFNPFAWILKKSIRQNLEYLTDEIMLHMGTDATEYQYLLLRSVRQGALRFTLTFNYHSLKSRIIMINRFKSHPLQRLKFLLLAPLLLFVLFAFRSASPVIIKYGSELIPSSFDNNFAKIGQPISDNIVPSSSFLSSASTDTVPATNKSKHRSSRNDGQEYSLSWSDDDNDKVKRITMQGDSKNGDIATVYLKNGEKEIYDLNNDDSRNRFEDKYGDLIQNHLPPIPPIPPVPPMPAMPPMPPMPPMPAIPPMPPMPPMGFGFDLPDDVTEISQTTESVKLKFKDGTTETYDLTDPKQKKKFRDKYHNQYYREE